MSLCDTPSRILYVEDDPGLAILFKKRLERLGYAVDIAADGVSGLRAFSSDSYDVLCVDYHMPGMSGLELIRILLGRGELPATIMVTGAGDERVAVDAIKLGASDYVIKDSECRYLELMPAVIEQAWSKRLLMRAHKKAQEELERSRANFAGIVEKSPDAILVLDGKGLALYANSAAARLFGKPSAALVGTDLGLPALTDEVTISEVTQPSGEQRSAEMRAHLVDWHGKPAVLTVLRDVTARRRAEAALVESEHRYRMLFELAGDAIFIIKAEGHEAGRIVGVNRAAAEIHGYSVAEMLNMNISQLSLAQDSPRVTQLRDDLLRQGNIKQECMQRRKDGTAVPLEINAGLLELDGQQYVFSIGRDMTDFRKAMQFRLEAERMKGVAEMASGVAHNFNNLLQILTGASRLALDDLQEGQLTEVRAGLEKVLACSRRGSQTLKRMLHFAQVGVPKPAQEDRVIDLSDVVRESLEMTKPWWKAGPEMNGVVLHVNPVLQEGCFVRGRDTELFEMVVNLIKNALEALPRGGEIRIGTRGDVSHVVLTVEDNGLGIPADRIDAIFEPFCTIKGPEGTGLGLTSCRAIATGHKGKISVQSTEGVGTTFTVILPPVTRAEAELRAQPAER